MNTHDRIKLPPLPETSDLFGKGYTSLDMMCFAKDAIEADRQVRGEPVAPEGFRLIAVNEAFDSLTFWLDRCEQKGHLENCADLVEPWEVFEYREVEAPQPQQQAGAASALKFAAQVVELYDDATMRDDYMIDSGECAGILNALADYFARFFPQPPQIPPERPYPDTYLATWHEAKGWNDCRRAMLEAAPEVKG